MADAGRAESARNTIPRAIAIFIVSSYRQARLGKASDRKMRRAWLRDNPGEAPLPEHLCALDHPYPGFKRWAAKARRWIDHYERTYKPR